MNINYRNKVVNHFEYELKSGLVYPKKSRGRFKAKITLKTKLYLAYTNNPLKILKTVEDLNVAEPVDLQDVNSELQIDNPLSAKNIIYNPVKYRRKDNPIGEVLKLPKVESEPKIYKFVPKSEFDLSDNDNELSVTTTIPVSKQNSVN